MSLTFADTHNMVAYLNKSDVSKGFNQVIDFLNGSYIKYALTVNPTIYVSCIKQFWNTVFVKQSNDVTRLQALVDKQKVLIPEATIRDVLRLGDVEGVDCLPNKEIFAELARMVRNLDSSSKFYMYPKFIQLIIQNQLGDLLTRTTKYISPALTQKVFANMRRVGKGFSGVETPLFECMLVAGENVEEDIAVERVQDDAIVAAVQEAQPQGADFSMSLLQEALDVRAALTRRVEHLKHDKVAQDLEIIKLKTRVKKLEKANKGRMIDELDSDEGAVLMGEKEEEKKAEEVKDIIGAAQVEGRQAEIYQIDMDDVAKVLKVVTAASTPVSAASKIILAADPKVPAATITVALVKVAAASIRRRRKVVIKDPEVESSAKTHAETKSKDKDKGKGIMVEDPKPMKKKEQVEMDGAYERKLHEELNQDIDWDVAIDHVKQKAKEDPYVQRYQVMKKRPQTEAQARRNMIIYLKNTAGFRLEYFKGMSYDDIHPIFKAKFNSNIEFLLKSKKQIEEEENRSIESINETLAQKAAKRRKLNEEVEYLKQHLEIVPNEDDDVYTEATLLSRKVPVVDYQIDFDREDLESLWSLVKERFSTSKPNNFSDDYLISTLRAMFERPDGQDQVWKSQRTVHGQAVRLQVEEQSEMSLELLRFTRQQLQEGQHE
nr:hypothetical protein [Tanacetum cinerariifolium]